jgi:hypothetical protein
MIVKTQKFGITPPTKPINLKCPVCLRQNTLTEYKQINDLTTSTDDGPILIGVRRCANPECYTHIYFIQQNNTINATFPLDKMSFDASNIPARIVHSLQEAINCYSNDCFIAAAIMIRKTLEELCQDRNAGGKNLKERINSLRAKVILPTELLDGLDELRLLGNDAAHIESQEFEKVGKEEVSVAIEFTKEVLKAVYQYTILANRFQSLKKHRALE